MYDDPQNVQELFEEGFDSEQRQIEAITRHLLSDDDRALLREHNLSIADVLNGRFTIALDDEICHMFKRWNRILGSTHFIEKTDSAAIIEWLGEAGAAERA